MYSPELSEKVTKTLYRLKRVWNKPMTEIADYLIQKSLGALDKEFICEPCALEKNNDCSNCCLSSSQQKEVVSVEQAKC